MHNIKMYLESDLFNTKECLYVEAHMALMHFLICCGVEITSVSGSVDIFSTIHPTILDYVEKDSRITRWAYMSQNVGAATAWNLGMAISNSEYIVVLSDDCMVGPTTYENMISEFSDSDVGVVGVQWGGLIQDAAPVPKGFLLAYKKSMVKNIGGYSEKSAPLADEREFCLRALANGYKAKVANNCSWHHIHDICNHPHTVIKYLGNDWIPASEVPKYELEINPTIEQYNKKIKQ
jgi:GT2 family glycosyltransferase